MLKEKLIHTIHYWENIYGSFWIPRVILGNFIDLLMPVLSPVKHKSIQMLFHLGYWPNIRAPRSFNEKIAYRQLFAPHPLAPLLADKWRVREYVAQRGLAHILNEVYYVTDKPETIPFDDLPDEFVIKANHGCGWNIFVKNKKYADKPRIINMCRKWLKMKYSKVSKSHETHYDSILPLILIERFLYDKKYGKPLDYKFSCFHGKPYYIEVNCYKSGVLRKNIYDINWNPMNFSHKFPKGNHLPRPAKLDVMLDIATCLSNKIDYCRIDLYLLNDEKVVFGEITMNPNGGLGKFCPKEWDFKLGELW